jgi:acyl-CoA thioester hydrolase
MTREEFTQLYPDFYSSDVRWGDMDSMQHVNNTVFFRYFECSRMVFWDRLVKNLQNKFPKEIGPILASTSCQFKRPIYYPDSIVVGTKVTKTEEDRFTMEHTIWSEREQRIVALGEAVVVSYDYKAKQKAPIPSAWKEFMGF